MKPLAADCIKSLVSRSLIPRALELAVAAPPALSPLLTDQAYALFLKSGHPLHPFLSTPLIARSARSGDFPRSSLFLSDTRSPDAVAFNALISGLASFRRPGPALALLDELRLRGLCPDAYTFSSLVKACGSVWENEIVHGVCLKYGFSASAYVVSGLVENYAGGGEVGAAEKCFEDCEGVDNVVWVAMVSGYVWNGEFDSAKELFVEMRGLGLEVNEYSMTAVLGALLDGREGGQVHGFGLKMGLLSGCSLHLSNSIMHMYSRCGSQADAVKAFDEISEPDVVSWSERIFAACDGVEASELFKLLHSKGVMVNEFTVINLLSQIIDVKFFNLGKQIHALSFKRGHMQLVSVGNALISLYGKVGQIVDAMLVFDEMRLPDPISWNSLIAAYSENHLLCQCLEAFSKMRSRWVLPNSYALASILEVVAHSNLQELAAQIHSLMIKFGLMFDDSMVSALITAYGKCNRVDESRKIFAKLDRIKALHLNSLMVTFVSTGYHDDALVLFQRSWHSCIAVDSMTLSILLKACGALTDLEQGRTIHCLSIKNGFDQDSFIESAIIDVYCKCGSINDAEKAYKNISRYNLVARNAMMMGTSFMLPCWVGGRRANLLKLYA
ncbi:pentatricopeptide repeat-containing protein At1g71460, chloroplastic-like isoform X2 [Syzygium oleosum]|uniref:pentatricopeptide repeat-containing protein At1g71460, chloroplastic-like isoform X2 n=1 Tax=Syzygium oleosum TaxID=219896 RepID=UPI0024B9816B|nr:pentatricopeptide repeat-containing protein At1g71460, chloroplastic-like isoform X2 [Syzygium oleosum]